MTTGPRTILKGVVGSTAYGMATPTSDKDYLAVHMDPLGDVLSIGWQARTVTSKDPDCASHELAKFLRLALAANPTVVELLWLDDYEIRTEIGDQLIAMRSAFLSKRARNTYGGYVRQQAHRLVNRGGTFDPDLARRTPKHGRHCARLLLQGRALAEFGELRVRLTPAEVDWCFGAGEAAAEDPAEFQAWVSDEIESLDFYFDRSSLPDEPSVDTANALLLSARLEAVR